MKIKEEISRKIVLENVDLCMVYGSANFGRGCTISSDEVSEENCADCKLSVGSLISHTDEVGLLGVVRSAFELGKNEGILTTRRNTVVKGK